MGEEEARKQLYQYLRDLKNPDIEYISVKISTIFSQILPLAFDHSVDSVSERLSLNYTARRQRIILPEPTAAGFPNL